MTSLVTPAFAADITHAPNNSWDLTTGWVGGVVPGKNDRAIITGGPATILVNGPWTDVQDFGSFWLTSTATLSNFSNASMHAIRFYGTDGIAALNESSRTVGFFQRTILANDLIFRASNAAGGGFNWTVGSVIAGAWVGIDLAGHTATFDTVNAVNTMTFSSTSIIQGAGNIIKTGAGTLTINNVSQYTGSTTIDAGTLALTGGGSIASSSGLHNDGVFDIAATTAGASVKTLSGTGVVKLGAQTLTLTSAHDTFAGIIQGTGGLTLTGGTQTLSGANTYSGGTIVSDSTLAAGAANAFSSASAHTVLSSGTLALNGFNQTLVSLDNAGVVTFGSAPGTTLTVTGNYVGNGGILNLNAKFGGDTSMTDRVVVNGSTSGSTTLRVTNLGGGGAATTDGIKIVDVVGASNGAFTLQGDYTFYGQQAIVAGAYAYTLQKNGVTIPTDGDWYLRSSLFNPPPAAPSGPIYQPGVPLYEAMPQVLHALNGLSTLQQRVGNRYWDTSADGGEAASPGGEPMTERSAFWGRTEGSYGSFKPTSSTTLSGTNIGQWKARTGLDVQLYVNQDGTLIGGVTAHFGTAIADIRSKYGDGRVSATGTGFGGTLTWYGESGFYVDGQAQATFFNSNLKSDVFGRDMANGIGGVGYATSIETGKRFGVNGPWALTPQAQLVYSALDVDFADSFANKISLGRSDSLNGRLGIALDHQRNWRDARGEITRANVYGITNVYYEFLDGTRVDVAGTNFTGGYEKLAAGFGFGGTYNWGNDKYTVYGEALVKTSFNDNYSVGGTAGFRAKW
jgi:fibronectin-binding autotransporter adhesin